MNAIRVILDVDQDPPLAGLDASKTVRVQDGVAFTRIPGGMSSGASAVGITAPLPPGDANVLNVVEKALEYLYELRGEWVWKKGGHGRNAKQYDCLCADIAVVEAVAGELRSGLKSGGAVFIELSMANFTGAAAAFNGAEERAKECDGRN